MAGQAILDFRFTLILLVTLPAIISSKTEMLHNCQERALGPVPQRVDFLVGSRGWAGCPPKKGLLTMVQDVRSNQPDNVCREDYNPLKIPRNVVLSTNTIFIRHCPLLKSKV